MDHDRTELYGSRGARRCGCPVLDDLAGDWSGSAADRCYRCRLWFDPSTGCARIAAIDLGAARTAWVFVAAVAALETASTFLFLAAVNFSPAVLNDPARLEQIGDRGADLLRAGAQLDMFGYLLAVPLAIFLYRRFERQPGIDLFTLAGVAALTLGALGAAVFAYGGAPLVHEFAGASETIRPTVETSFATLHRIVFFGLWQTLDAALAGLWLVGTGRLAWKQGSVALATVLIAFGSIGGVIAVAHVSGFFPGS
jgi:hypothetical protein